jgi:hypothetical protein
MKVLLRISRFPVFPAKKKTALLIVPKCVSANKWEVLHIRYEISPEIPKYRYPGLHYPSFRDKVFCLF